MNEIIKFRKSGFAEFMKELGEDGDFLDEPLDRKWVWIAVLFFIIYFLGVIWLSAFWILFSGTRLFLQFLGENKVNQIIKIGNKLNDSQRLVKFWETINEKVLIIEKLIKKRLVFREVTDVKQSNRVFMNILVYYTAFVYLGPLEILGAIKILKILHEISEEGFVEVININMSALRPAQTSQKQINPIQKSIINTLDLISSNSFDKETLNSQLANLKNLIWLSIDCPINKPKSKVPIIDERKTEEVVISQPTLLEEDVFFIIEGQGEKEKNVPEPVETSVSIFPTDLMKELKLKLNITS